MNKNINETKLEIKSNAYCEALQYRQDLLPFTIRKHSSLSLYVVQKITIIRASVVVPSGGAEKNLNMGAQLHTIVYIKPLNLF